TQCQRGDDCDAKTWRFEELSHPQAQVLADGFEHRPRPFLAHRLFQVLRSTELRQRSPACLYWRHTSGFIFRGQHLHVGANFVIEVFFYRATMEEISKQAFES